jgi:ribosomal protein S18 acetylase RimI-like enzyme
MNVRLRPLRDDELPAFIAHGKREYARDMVENAGLSAEQAQKKSDKDWALLLPNDQVPSGHYLFAIEEESSGERIGDLWFAERTNDFDSTVAFVYSIEIAEPFRGRGYGREAMLLLEDEVRGRGLSHVALNVFGGNEVARSLYRSLGYAETAVWMRKAV